MAIGSRFGPEPRSLRGGTFPQAGLLQPKETRTRSGICESSAGLAYIGADVLGRSGLGRVLFFCCAPERAGRTNNDRAITGAADPRMFLHIFVISTILFARNTQLGISLATVWIPMTGVKRSTRHSWPEALRDSTPCSAVAAPKIARMHGWKPTDFTGRHQRLTLPVHGSTTLPEAGKLFIVKAAARSRERFRFGVSKVTSQNPGLLAEMDRQGTESQPLQWAKPRFFVSRPSSRALSATVKKITE
jgi:hypothetical protein